MNDFFMWFLIQFASIVLENFCIFIYQENQSVILSYFILFLCSDLIWISSGDC